MKTSGKPEPGKLKDERLCPACGAGSSAPFHEERGFAYSRCRRCATVFLDPRPAPEKVDAHYDDYLPSDPALIERWRGEQAGVIERAGRLFSKLLPRGARTLDVGCGFGFLVKRLAQAGFAAEGIDLSATGIGHARSIGAPAQIARIEDPVFEPESFDAVSAFYVIEHLRDPGAFLSSAARLLKPGGYLLLRWPQSAPLVRWCKLLGIRIDLFDAPSHLTDFTPQSLSGLLARSGLETRKTWPGGSTMPRDLVPRIAGVAGGLVGDFLYAASIGRFIAPGASKNTLARKGTPGVAQW